MGRTALVGRTAKSSCYYFRSFPIDQRRIEFSVHGDGMNTDSLVEYILANYEYGVSVTEISEQFGIAPEPFATC
jgi:hypothetical protein